MDNKYHVLLPDYNAQFVDLMDLLREIPGREALKLRAEVSSRYV